jgi:hypothetical protein
LRDALLSLESDSAYLSDVYNAVLFLWSAFQKSDDWSLNSLLARIDFFVHPAHVAAYLLDPRYSLISTYKESEANVLIIAVSRYVLQLTDLKDITSQVAAFFQQRGLSRQGLCPDGYDWFSLERSGLEPMQWWSTTSDLWPLLAEVAGILFSMPSSAASAERVWSAHDYIITKRRNRLATPTSNKLVYVFFNSHSGYFQRKARTNFIPATLFQNVHPKISLRLLGSDESSIPQFEDDYCNHDYDETAQETGVNAEAHDHSQFDESPEQIALEVVEQQRTFSRPIVPIDQVKVHTGLHITCWYPTPEGWYSAIVIEFNEVTRKYMIGFADNSYDYTTLSVRQYGNNGTWLVEAPATEATSHVD